MVLWVIIYFSLCFVFFKYDRINIIFNQEITHMEVCMCIQTSEKKLQEPNMQGYPWRYLPWSDSHGLQYICTAFEIGNKYPKAWQQHLSYRDMVLTPRRVHSHTVVTISGVSTLGFINNILIELGTLTFPAQLEILSKYFKTYVLFQLLKFYLLLSVKPFKIPFAWFSL